MTKFTLGKHSSSQFSQEMESIRNHLLRMGGLVAKQLADALEALLNNDSALAEKVLITEDEVDELEKRIDEECARVLALRQPAAIDLRTILAVSKCVSDLERIGDESAKIAQQSLQQEGELPISLVGVKHIGHSVQDMLDAALNAFARFDAEKAIEAAARDDEVDTEYQSAMRSLVTLMMEDPRSITRVLNLMWVLRSLERVGDHARNICEQVIYLVKGKDVRHFSVDEMVAAVQSKRSHGEPE